MLVLLTRPRPDSEALARRLRAAGIDSIIAPLLDIRIDPGPMLDTANVAALLMTSANGVRAFVARAAARHIPVFAVGAATAAAARHAGFDEVYAADGDVASLAALATQRLPPHSGQLLHPAAGQVAGDLAARLTAEGYDYRREVIYQSVAAKRLSPATIRAFRDRRIDGVLLYSPRTGRVFQTLITRAGLAGHLDRVRSFCLSQAVADTVAELTWAEILSAPKPDQDALLACLT